MPVKFIKPCCINIYAMVSVAKITLAAPLKSDPRKNLIYVIRAITALQTWSGFTNRIEK